MVKVQHYLYRLLLHRILQLELQFTGRKRSINKTEQRSYKNNKHLNNNLRQYSIQLIKLQQTSLTTSSKQTKYKVQTNFKMAAAPRETSQAWGRVMGKKGNRKTATDNTTTENYATGKLGNEKY